MPAARPRPRSLRPRSVAAVLFAAVAGLLVHAFPAAAASGPTVVDVNVSVSVSTYETVLPGARDDTAGSSAIKYGLTVFTADQPTPVPPGGEQTPTLLYDPGFGTWKVLGDGRMTFDTRGVTGTRSVRYRITDANGLTAEGLQTVVVTAGAGNDDLVTTQSTSVTADLLANDTPGRNADGTPGTLDRSSLRWRAAQGAPVRVSSDGLVVDFPGIGFFTIDATTRLVTFVPDLSYVRINDSYSLYYTAQDTTRAADGSVEHHQITGSVRWDVRPLDALAVTETASPELYVHVGDPLTFTTTIKNVGPTPLTGVTLTHSLGARLTQTCSPALGSGIAAGATTTCTATTRATQGDVDSDDASVRDVVVVTATTTRSGQSIPLREQTGASTATRITQGLTATAAASPATVSAAGQQVAYTVVVRNRGNRSVTDLVVGSSSRGVPALVCSPVALGGTLGDGKTTTCRATRTVTAADLATPELTATVKARAVPVTGSHARAANAVVTITTPVTVRGPVVRTPAPHGIPIVEGDSARTTVGRPVVVDVLANDRPGSASVPLVGSSVRLQTDDPLPPGSALWGDTKTLTVAGRGVFLVSGTGQITFVPFGTTTGPLPLVGYLVSDAAGTTAGTALGVEVQ